MAVFKVETKNKVDIDKKPRVYFTCHSEDFEKYFKKICDDIFKTHDCAIYYSEDMTEVIAEDEKSVDLGRNNLFVVPVTFKLLTTPNRAMDEDIPYALKEHIPVLPIMMEPGIDEFYSKPDKFGELQYLNPYSTDLTEISYEEKLKKYLESVLISDELAKRVRAAFDAYIFLSYRKKDRKCANELMRLIHSNPECRDIAIWFDEFLTPGESFKENIEKILDDCKLFTLLVTPQLLEKVVDENGEERDNYVISTELPLARKKKEEKGTDIFAVEMEETDKEALSTINIVDYVNPKDEIFRTRLLETISRMAITTNNTPEHNFLIGLAYLEGIDVEINRQQGIGLIESAADEGFPIAMEELFRIYSNGIGVTLDYCKAVLWAEKHADYMVTHYGEEHKDTLVSLGNLAFAYGNLGNYEKKLELLEHINPICIRVLGKEHPDTLGVMNNLAITYSDYGKYKKALELQEKLYEICSKSLGAEHPKTLIILNSLANTYMGLRNYEEGFELQKRVLTLRCKVLGEEHCDTLTSLSNLAYIYGELGDHKKQQELNAKAYTLRNKVLGENHPDTLSSLNNLAFSYCELEDYKEALKLMNKAYLLRCSVLGEEHPDTITSLSNLAYTYAKKGDYEKSLDLQERIYNASIHTHPNILIFLNNLAITYGKMENFEKALEITEKIYKLQCERMGEEEPETLDSLRDIALIYGKLGNLTKQMEICEKVYTIRCKVLGENHTDTLNSLNDLIFIYSRLGHYTKALEVNEKMYSLLCRLLGEEHNNTLTALSNLASVLGKLGNHEKELELTQKLYDLLCNAVGETHSKTLVALHKLASVYGKLRNYEEELRITQKLYSLRCEMVGEEHPNTLSMLNELAYIYYKLGDYVMSLSICKKHYSIVKRVFGPEHSQTLNVLANLNQVRKKVIEDEYKRKNVCQYCGGKFRGIIKKICSVCKKPKDY